jgi:hypothetical protein
MKKILHLMSDHRRHHCWLHLTMNHLRRSMNLHRLKRKTRCCCYGWCPTMSHRCMSLSCLKVNFLCRYPSCC